MRELGLLVGVTLTPLCCCCEASNFSEVRKISLNAEKIFKGEQKTDFVEFTWQGSSSSTRYLKRLEIVGSALDKLIDLSITIPGEIDGKQVIVSNTAFQDLTSKSVRLRLNFKEKNGKKVKLPQDCTEMFSNSPAIYDLDFSGVDTSKTTKMNKMFLGCENIHALNLKYFNTENLEAKDLERMFVGCSGLKLLDVSSFKSRLKTDEALYYMLTDRYDSPGYVEGMYEYYIDKSNLKVIVDSPSATSGKKRSEGYTRDSSSSKDNVHFGKEDQHQSALNCSKTPKKNTKKYIESAIKEDSLMATESRDNPRSLNLYKYLISENCEEGLGYESDDNDTGIEVPIKLPKVGDTGAKFTKNPGIVVTTPAIKLPIAAQDGHFVSKRYDKVPVQLPKASAEGATITKTNKIVNVTPAMKVQNKDINRCYFSKQTVNKEATDIKNTLERNENMAQVKEEVTKGKKRDIKPVMGTSQQAKHKITWYSCIVKVWKDFVSAWKRLASRVVSSFK